MCPLCFRTQPSILGNSLYFLFLKVKLCILLHWNSICLNETRFEEWLRSLCTTALPSSLFTFPTIFVSSDNFISYDFTFISISLSKILDNLGPNTEPFGTSLETSPLMRSKLISSVLWVQTHGIFMTCNKLVCTLIWDKKKCYSRLKHTSHESCPEHLYISVGGNKSWKACLYWANGYTEIKLISTPNTDVQLLLTFQEVTSSWSTVT